MGGRGASFEGKKVSLLVAKVVYNGSRKMDLRGSGEVRTAKELDAEINKNYKNVLKGKDVRINVAQTEKTLDLLKDRELAVRRKIAALPNAESLQKRRDLYYRLKAIQNMEERIKKEYNKGRSDEFKPRHVENNTITTTYDRTRKRRQKNFDAWFYGSK